MKTKAQSQDQSALTAAAAAARIAFAMVFLVAVSHAFSQAALNRDGIVCGNGIHVRLTNGSLQTSNDRFAWTNRPLPVRTFLRSVAFGDGVFVSVGGSYLDVPAVILTSRDGITWVQRSHPAKNNLYAVAFGNGLFVAVGDEGAISTSRDGFTWKPRRSPDPGTLLATVAWGNGIFVAGGESGAIVTSGNGMDWVAGNLGESLYIANIKFCDGRFFANNCRAAFSSVDGLTWHRCDEMTAVP